MTARQNALLDYHRDVAAFAVTKPDTVFVVLDLEDREGLAIAREIDPRSGERRDAIASGGCIPALTLPLDGANALLARGWPNAKPIPPARGSVPIMLVSDGRCVCLLMRRG